MVDLGNAVSLRQTVLVKTQSEVSTGSGDVVRPRDSAEADRRAKSKDTTSS